MTHSAEWLAYRDRQLAAAAEWKDKNSQEAWTAIKRVTTGAARQKRYREKRSLEDRCQIYGVPMDIVLQLLPWGCGICGCFPNEVSKLQFDHDHLINKFRGLLCRPCNYHFLGGYGDSRERFDRAVAYFDRAEDFAIDPAIGTYDSAAAEKREGNSSRYPFERRYL